MRRYSKPPCVAPLLWLLYTTAAAAADATLGTEKTLHQHVDTAEAERTARGVLLVPDSAGRPTGYKQELLIPAVTVGEVQQRAPEIAAVLRRKDNQKLLQVATKPINLFFPLQLTGQGKERRKLYVGTAPLQAEADELRLQLSLEGAVVRLQLTRNSQLMAPSYTQKSFVSGTADERKGADCYYQGHVRRLQNTTSASLAACGGGVRGLLRVADVSYVLEPLHGVLIGQQLVHALYRSPSGETSRCANADAVWSGYPQLHPADFLRALKNQREPLQPVARRLELALIMDSDIYIGLNRSARDVISYAKRLLNAADSYVKGSGLRLSLAYLEVWDSIRRFPVRHSARVALQNALEYRHRVLTSTPHHVLVLVTLRRFSNDVSGMAIPDSICSDRAVAVVRDSSLSNMAQTASRLVHMLGHVVGMTHEDDAAGKCECRDLAGCLMQTTFSAQAAPTQFASCSIRDLQHSLIVGLPACLPHVDGSQSSAEPARFSQTCGNGVLERGEECDCGHLPRCALWDPCCNGSTCLLKSWASCRDGACCKDCQPRPVTHVCRAAADECDVPETCDGERSTCPADVYARDGSECSAGRGLCYRGRCPTHDRQCTRIWGLGASKADDECFEHFNVMGDPLQGHCGFNTTTKRMQACEPRDALCGLLQCRGGAPAPLLPADRSYRTTHLKLEAEHQCKVATLPPPVSTAHLSGMTWDGTRCGPASLCLARQCVPVTSLAGRPACPWAQEEICAGHGVCTNLGACVCHPGYSGDACDQQVVSTAPYPLPQRPRNISLSPRTGVKPAAPVHPATSGTGANSTEKLSTTNLLLTLGGVVMAGGLVLLAALFLYRRRAPRNSRKSHVRGAGGTPLLQLKHSGVPQLPRENRGRRSRHRRQQSDSESSLEMTTCAEHITVVHDRDAKQPERGILKKSREPKQSRARGGRGPDACRPRSEAAPLLQPCQQCIRRSASFVQQAAPRAVNCDSPFVYGSLDSLNWRHDTGTTRACDCRIKPNPKRHSPADALSSLSDVLSSARSSSLLVDVTAGFAGLQPTQPSELSTDVLNLSLLSLEQLSLSDSNSACTEPPQIVEESSALSKLSAALTCPRPTLPTQEPLAAAFASTPEVTNSKTRPEQLELKHIDTLMAMLRQEDEVTVDPWQLPRPHSPATSEDVRSSEPEADRCYRKYSATGASGLLTLSPGSCGSSLLSPLTENSETLSCSKPLADAKAGCAPRSLTQALRQPSWRLTAASCPRPPLGPRAPPGHSASSAFRPCRQLTTSELCARLPKPTPVPCPQLPAPELPPTSFGSPPTSISPLRPADNYDSRFTSFGVRAADDIPRKHSTDFELVTFSRKCPEILDNSRRTKFLRQQDFVDHANT